VRCSSSQPDTLLLRGTFIRCALETRIITDVNGFTSCVSPSRCIRSTAAASCWPKGSKVFGQYGSGAIRGERVAVGRGTASPRHRHRP
jgi:type IV secretion system protein VirB10